MSFYNMTIIVVDHENRTHVWPITALNEDAPGKLIEQIESVVEAGLDSEALCLAHPNDIAVTDKCFGPC